TDFRTTAALPDDRWKQRPSGRALPDDEGFALVGNPDGGEITCLGTGSAQRLSSQLNGRLIDLLGIMLDPSGPRIELGNLAVRTPAYAPGSIDYQHSRAGGSLVDSENKVGHSFGGIGYNMVSLVSAPQMKPGVHIALSFAGVKCRFPCGAGIEATKV